MSLRSATTCGLLLLAVVVVPPAARGQGTLEELRSDVRESTAEDDDAVEDRPRRRRGRYAGDDCPEDDSLMADLLAIIFTSPFWGPHILLGDDFSAEGEFLSYPYKRDWEGNMIVSPDYSPFTKWWQMRARGEYAHDFDRLSRAGGHLLVETTSRFGFDTSFDFREERLPAGDEDGLWTGDVNLLYRFAQTEQIQMRAGIGANWLADDEGSDLGFNFTYGGDLMPLRPLVVSAEIDWGRLGNASLFHGRATIGVAYRHVELYTGYDYFDVGNTQIDGWIAGLRLWF